MQALSVAARIREKITAAFSPCTIQLEDQSPKHAGHAGAKPGGETHFHLEIVSPAFAGLSRVERQRRVHAALKDELEGPVHALSLSLKMPEEAA
ncbi:MAG: BolA family transcriptional regulator [Proteobacteria bacterium]|nr:BolA family transcriptional regulator [Pseudomonadota bacterium]